MTNFYFCLFSVSSKSPFQTHQHLSTSPCCILLPLRTDDFSSLGSTGASQTAWPEVQTWARPSLLLGSRVQHPQVLLFPTAGTRWFEGWYFPGLVSFCSIYKLLDLLPTLASIWNSSLAGLFLRLLSAQVQGVLAIFSRGTKYSTSISLPFEHLTQKKRPQQSTNPNCSFLRH